MPNAREILERLMEDEDYDAAEDFYTRVDEQLADIVGEFRATQGRKKVSWPKLKTEPISKIWLEYGKRGSISDEEGMAKIADQVMTLIARLHVTTVLSGHSSEDNRPEAEDHFGRAFTDKEWDALLDMLEDEKGNYLLSDYGMKPLEALYTRLHRARTPEEQLQVVDRVLNVVHQRSDLAALFIQGGSATLNRIASQGGYSTFQDPENMRDAQVKAQHGYATGLL
jgi:hypothetical protein